MNLLVVDHDSDACELFARVFEGEGYAAVRCYDHDDAVGRVAVDPVDLVLIAFSGGGGGHLRLLESIRSLADPAAAAVRAVVVADDTRDQAGAWQSGADGFLTRPLHSSRLLATVAEVLARPEAERADHRRAHLDDA